MSRPQGARGSQRNPEVRTIGGQVLSPVAEHDYDHEYEHEYRLCGLGTIAKASEWGWERKGVLPEGNRWRYTCLR